MALKADRRGRRLAPTVAAYEAVCAGETRVAEALIARYTASMDQIGAVPPVQRLQMFAPLASIPLIDRALIDYGADVRRLPSSHSGEWVDHLLWAADSSVSVTRFLLSGQLVGAATLARHQLERWTLHRAYNGGVKKALGETSADFIARAWSTDDRFHGDWLVDAGLPPVLDPTDSEPMTPSSGLDHAHVTSTTGQEMCPAQIYRELSEFLHGRHLSDALLVGLDGMVVDNSWEPSVARIIYLITSSTTLCLRQVRVAVGSLAEDRRDLAVAIGMKGSLDSFSKVGDDFARAEVIASVCRDFGIEPPDAERKVTTSSTHVGAQTASQLPPLTPITPEVHVLAPLLPNEGLSEVARSATQTGSNLFVAGLRGQPFGRQFTDDEFTTLAFSWHRGRSLRGALGALEFEQRMLGDEFDEEKLTARASGWVFVSEAARLTSLWVDNSAVGTSLAAAGSGLQSASWLWLEDDDRSMAVLRVVLEHAAILRACRLKPTQAERLQQGAGTRPRDWLQLAGWRRLSALMRALNEFAHTTPTSSWSGARELLARLQPDAPRERAIYTARGSALEFVTDLVAQEVVQQLDVISKPIATRVRELLAGPDWDSTQAMEARLNFIWGERSGGLGPIEWNSGGSEDPDGSTFLQSLPLTSAALDDQARRGLWPDWKGQGWDDPVRSRRVK